MPDPPRCCCEYCGAEHDCRPNERAALPNSSGSHHPTLGILGSGYRYRCASCAELFDCPIPTPTSAGSWLWSCPRLHSPFRAWTFSKVPGIPCTWEEWAEARRRYARERFQGRLAPVQARVKELASSIAATQALLQDWRERVRRTQARRTSSKLADLHICADLESTVPSWRSCVRRTAAATVLAALACEQDALAVILASRCASTSTSCAT